MQWLEEVKQSVNPNLLLIAMLFVAVLAGVIGVLGLLERQHLLKHGVETTGVVVGIDVGAKGARSVEAKFETLDGQMVVGRDLHLTQWFDSNKIGDQVSLRYDPEAPERILISRGLWIWLNPAFLLASSIAVGGLGVILYKKSPAKDVTD